MNQICIGEKNSVVKLIVLIKDVSVESNLKSVASPSLCKLMSKQFVSKGHMLLMVINPSQNNKNNKS